MARTITTSLSIDAPPEAVWSALVDFGGPQWSTLFASVSGELALGQKLKLVLRKPKLTLRPRVTALEPPRRFDWRGHTLIPGLVDGHHAFELEPENGGTRFHHRESFSGLLVPLMGGPIAETARNFDAFNRALEASVQARPSSGR